MNVGFIGTGKMGNPVALNILNSGHKLFVHDINKQATQNLLEEGAMWCETLLEIAKHSYIIFLCLPSHFEVEEVCFGNEGLFNTIEKGTFLIDLTTVSISLIPKLEEAEKRYQIHYVVSPVSQGVDNAKKGKLSVFVGGKREDYKKCLPIYSTISNKVIYTGDHISAISAKLLTNLLWFINAASIAEALILGAKSGINLATLQEVIINSSGNSWVAEHDIPSIYNGSYDHSFTTKQCCKDLRLIYELATHLNVPIEIGSLVEQIFKRVSNVYGDDSPELSVVKHLEDITKTGLSSSM